jgi:hypothetical protein
MSASILNQKINLVFEIHQDNRNADSILAISVIVRLKSRYG